MRITPVSPVIRPVRSNDKLKKPTTNKGKIMQKPSKNTETLSDQFERSACGVASQFSFDLHDVKKAYGKKKDSLNLIFNTMSAAKSDRASWIGWSVFWAIVIPPIALYTAYKAYESHAQLMDTEYQVKAALQPKKYA